MLIEFWPLDRPVPYQRNARKISDIAVEKVAASIREFGWRQPIVVDAEGVIIAGHTRLLAAKHLHLTEVPVHIATDLTPAQVKAYRLMDNRSHEESGWDYDLLSQELFALKDLELDLKLTGFGDDELAELMVQKTAGLTDEDEVPVAPVEPVTRSGDTWILGRHRLLCGDCTKSEDLQHLMNGVEGDLLLTDPPYGVSYADKNRYLNAIAPAGRIQVPVLNDHQTPVEMSEFWKAAFSNCRPMMKNGASYYVTGPQGGDLLLLLQSLNQSGFPLRHMLIWAKNNHVLGRCDYHYQHEPIIYGWLEGRGHGFFGGHGETSLWQIPKPQKSDLHPTMKPVALYKRAITNSSKAGDAVTDPFCGSGTAVIACEELARRCFALELDPVYCDVIVTRWQNFTGREATLDGRTLAQVKEDRLAVAA